MYLRLICSKDGVIAKEEVSIINRAIDSSPYSLIKPIEPHPRGGYIAYVEIEKWELGSFSEHLLEYGIRIAI